MLAEVDVDGRVVLTEVEAGGRAMARSWEGRGGGSRRDYRGVWPWRCERAGRGERKMGKEKTCGKYGAAAPWV
jgi:hypothetical protein